MKRRHLLAGASVAALAAPALGEAPAVRWRMATSWPKSLDVLHASALSLAERVGEITEGRFQIRVFAAGEIVPALGVFDAAASGAIDCAHTLSGYFSGRDPALAFDGGLPFGLNSRQQQSWLRAGGGREALSEVFARHGLAAVACGSLGAQMGGWFRREIATAEDLNGLRMRIAGLGAAVLERLGAAVQPLAGGDIFSALEAGRIDAADWLGPHDDEKLGFGRAARFYYTPGWWKGTGQVTALAHAARWAALPTALRAAFEAAAAEQSLAMAAAYDRRNPQALRRLVAGGVQIRAFPRPVLEACHRASRDVLGEIAGRDPDFRRIYDGWKAFADDSNLWLRIAENTLDQFRYAAPRWGPA